MLPCKPKPGPFLAGLELVGFQFQPAANAQVAARVTIVRMLMVRFISCLSSLQSG
jgi:hypothetical protein